MENFTLTPQFTALFTRWVLSIQAQSLFTRNDKSNKGVISGLFRLYFGYTKDKRYDYKSSEMGQ